MMLLIQWRNSWIGNLALSFCLVLLVVLPMCWAQEGNQTEQPAPGTSATQAPGDGASVTPATATDQKPQPEAATTAEAAAQAEKLVKAKREKILMALTKKEFTYSPENMINPFITFIIAQAASSEAPKPGEGDDDGTPAKAQMPLTPLQKMAVGQIERGFKGVIWGDTAMRAMIEDGAGKGYIVGVGTPLGGYNGIITDIQSDRLVILQEVWDPNLKQMVPRSVEIKLTKAGDKAGGQK
jgi:Tfp pilus assembly protein PilP